MKIQPSRHADRHVSSEPLSAGRIVKSCALGLLAASGAAARPLLGASSEVLPSTSAALEQGLRQIAWPLDQASRGRLLLEAAPVAAPALAPASAPLSAPAPAPKPTGPRHDLSKGPYSVPGDICGMQKALRAWSEAFGDGIDSSGADCPQGGSYGALSTSQHGDRGTGTLKLNHCKSDGVFFDGTTTLSVQATSESSGTGTIVSDLTMAGAVSGKCKMERPFSASANAFGELSGSASAVTFCGKSEQDIQAADCP